MQISDLILPWYDEHARQLPWRRPPQQEGIPGELQDPYRVWLSEIMLQQTTVAAVRDYYTRFTTRWPTVHDLARARDEHVMAEWAGLGYYARARNLLKCARQVADNLEGAFPDDVEDLLKLPGIGPYTAGAIAAIAFGRPAVVVDGNVERVISRLKAIETPLPASRPEIRSIAAEETPTFRPGDYAQALMDLGATICTPRSPRCTLCPLSAACASAASADPGRLPIKVAKPPKPTRRGQAWVAISDEGRLLLERRPERGLLGGTLGFPGTEWLENPIDGVAPADLDWCPAGTVRHTFTHFHLELEIHTARMPPETQPVRGFLAPSEVKEKDLPSLMRKALQRAQGCLSS